MSQGGAAGSGPGSEPRSGLRRALRMITRPTVDNGGRTAAGDGESTGERQGMDQGMAALAYLISGVLLWGGAGWFADRVLHTSFLVGIGVVIGAGLGIYLVIARFNGTTGRPEPKPDGSPGTEPPTVTSPPSAHRSEESL